MVILEDSHNSTCIRVREYGRDNYHRHTPFIIPWFSISLFDRGVLVSDYSSSTSCVSLSLSLVWNQKTIVTVPKGMDRVKTRAKTWGSQSKTNYAMSIQVLTVYGHCVLEWRRIGKCSYQSWNVGQGWLWGMKNGYHHNFSQINARFSFTLLYLNLQQSYNILCLNRVSQIITPSSCLPGHPRIWGRNSATLRPCIFSESLFGTFPLELCSKNISWR